MRGKRYLDRSLESARADGAFPGIISRTTFDRVQATMWTYSKGKSSEQMLIELAAAYRRHGRLSQSIVKDDPDCSSPYVYRERFGSMEEAYRLVGFTMEESDKVRSDRIRLRQAGKAKTHPSNLPGEQMAIRFTDDTHLIQGGPNLPAAFDGLADKGEPET